MNALTWAGGVAGAVLAIGTLLRYVLRRTLRAAAWIAAVIALPDNVRHLAETITTLSTTVDRLTESVDTLQRSTDHGIHVPS